MRQDIDSNCNRSIGLFDYIFPICLYSLQHFQREHSLWIYDRLISEIKKNVNNHDKKNHIISICSFSMNDCRNWDLNHWNFEDQIKLD